MSTSRDEVAEFVHSLRDIGEVDVHVDPVTGVLHVLVVIDDEAPAALARSGKRSGGRRRRR